MRLLRSCSGRSKRIRVCPMRGRIWLGWVFSRRPRPVAVSSTEPAESRLQAKLPALQESARRACPRCAWLYEFSSTWLSDPVGRGRRVDGLNMRLLYAFFDSWQGGRDQSRLLRHTLLLRHGSSRDNGIVLLAPRSPEKRRRHRPRRPRAVIHAIPAYRSTERRWEFRAIRDALWCGAHGCRLRAPRRCSDAPCPSRRLMSVLFPAPDDPTNATVSPANQIGPQGVDAIAVQRADRHHVGAGGNGANLLGSGVEILAEVGFVQQNRALCSAGSGRQIIPLEPAQIEIAIEAGDDEYGIDIGGDHLRLCRIPSRLAKKRGAARHHLFDHAYRAPSRNRRRPADPRGWWFR